MSRRTRQIASYEAIDTKSNIKDVIRGPIKSPEPPTDTNFGEYTKTQLNNNECSTCHGFYCRSCGSTIPPKYRPFWDEKADPEIIKYYKQLQSESEKNNRKSLIESDKSQCVSCYPNKSFERRESYSPNDVFASSLKAKDDKNSYKK